MRVAVGFKSTKSSAAIRKNLVLAIAILVLCAAFVSACGGEGEEKPFDTIKNLSYACNDLDYNKMIDCFDPRITKVIMGLSKGLASQWGVGSLGGDAAAAAASLFGGFLSGHAAEFWEKEGITYTMTATEVSTEMDGKDKAKVIAKIDVETSNGYSDSREHTFDMVKIDGKWYITARLSDLGDLKGLIG